VRRVYMLAYLRITCALILLLYGVAAATGLTPVEKILAPRPQCSAIPPCLTAPASSLISTFFSNLLRVVL